MKKFKSQNKKSSSRLKKAAAVFAFVAVSFLAGYTLLKCQTTERKNAPIETVQSVVKPEKQESKPVFSRKAPNPPRKTDAQRKADEVLAKIVEEFPYETLDCELLPRKAEREDANESDLEEDRVRSKSNAILEFFSKFSRSMGALQENVEPWLHITGIDADLSMDIGQLVEDNNLEGMLSLLNYMDSLNIEWLAVDDKAGDLKSLYDIYADMRMEAAINDWEYSPSQTCVQKQVNALKTAYAAEGALAEMLLKNPGFAESVLGRLPEYKRNGVLERCANNLFWVSEEFDVTQVENFFAILSPASRAQFIDALKAMDIYDEEEQVIRAEHVAKYAADPELRDVMGAAESRWNQMIKAKDEPQEGEE